MEILILIIVAVAFWVIHFKLKYGAGVSILGAIILGVITPTLLLLFIDNMKLVVTLILICIGIIYWKDRSTESASIRQWRAKKNPAMTAEIFANTVLPNGYEEAAMPYNRAKYFSSGIENIDTENDFPLVYDAKPLNDEMLFREFGYLITTFGIIIKEPVKSKGSGNEYDIEVTQVPFQDIYRIDADENHIVVYYANHSTKTINLDASKLDEIKRILEIAINTGWTKNSSEWTEAETTKDQINRDLDRATKQASEISKYGKIGESVQLSSVNTSVTYDLGKNQINDRFGAGQGHGHVGEQYGDTLDRLRLRKAKRDGASHAKNGEDRIVNGRKIQTKYLKTANKSVGQVFNSDGSARYIDKNTGQMMAVEVPRDQYRNAIKAMERRIKNNEVPGKNGKRETDPSKANQYVKKGAISYEHSKMATKSIFDRNSEIPAYDQNNKVIRDDKGNVQMKQVTFGEKLIWSAGGDFMTGVASSMPTAMVTGIWIYCNCRWQGVDEKDALKNTVLATAKPVLWGGSMYMVSSQFAGSNIGKSLGNKMFSGSGISNATKTLNLTKATMGTLTVLVAVGPDIVNCIRGRISIHQLVKNSVVTGTGMVVGSVVGGMTSGPVGAAVGGMVGSAIGGLGAKKIMDHFMEDDVIEMIRIAKEEFIETVLSISLNTDEIEVILQDTFLNKKFNKRLKLMYAAANSRLYIHEVYFNEVVSVLKKRELPDEQMILAMV